MQVLLSWLREFVDISLAPEALAEALSGAGLAVEMVRYGGDDVLLDLDITSNRPDCLSHYGIAREIAAITSTRLAPLGGLNDGGEPGPPAALAVKVHLEAPEGCARYCVKVLERVRVAASPAAIASRLQALGHRAINNVADLTNYTLWEMGHPTHAFDLDQLEGAEIRVRRARAGETLVTLDGVERKLDPADLVIADPRRPIALAGVMGGLETAIGDATRRVAIESAWFDPLTVRRTAKRHGLHTDASHRFERGADIEAAPLAAQRIAARAQKQGMTVRSGMVDVGDPISTRESISLRPATLVRILGATIPEPRVDDILNRLGLQLELGRWRTPSWRHDLAREIDLVEEVARIHGLGQFPARLPAFAGTAALLPHTALERRIRGQLRAHGYSECVTLAFANEAECQAFAVPGTKPVRVLNPLNEEQAILRTSGVPALLHAVRNNLHRGAVNVRVYEIGKLYRHGKDMSEEPVLTVVSTGARNQPHWSEPDAALTFSDLKGEIAALLDHFDLPAVEFAPPPPHLHPGRGASLPCGWLGQLHPDLSAAWKVAPETWLAEIRLSALYAAGPRLVRYAPPSKFQASERDFSFEFEDTVAWSAIDATLHHPSVAALVDYRPLEIYRGAKLGAGRHSLLLRARFQRDDRTLRDEEVQAASDEIARRLTALGGRQR